MITLSKEDTIKLYYKNNKNISLKKRYKYITLHRWWCLNCKAEIFIKYDLISLSHIFCNNPDCKSLANHPTIVQYQYLRKLKEEQLKLFDNIK